MKLDTVGVHDNFFDLGGHSLLAIQIISRVRETFDKNVPLVAIFEMPTIAGLASTVEKAINGGSCDLPSIVPLPRDGPLPLSIAQEQLWQLDEMLPGTHFFNVPFVYRLSGPLDIAGLESLSETIGQHEILRTVYPKVDGLPVGLIKEVSNLELQVTDLRDRASDDLVQATTDLILEARKHPFNLRQGPLIQIQLLRLADEESLLLVTSHHIIIDQWSMRVLRSELVTLYKAFSRGAPSPCRILRFSLVTSLVGSETRWIVISRKCNSTIGKNNSQIRYPYLSLREWKIPKIRLVSDSPLPN